jgi:flagellar biosynthesis GTPase FlhF
MPETIKNFKQFERLFAGIRREKRENRVQGVGLLTPELIRKHIKSGRDLILQYGRQGEFVHYTLADLQEFAKALQQTKKDFGPQKGVPVSQLLAASDPMDIMRSNQQIKNVTLYKVKGGQLYFRASASPGSKYAFHQVRVRLDDWNDQLTTIGSYVTAARNAVTGRVSYDCDCGRHQYWYRYLATIGGFALSPLEKDFPKIRNPQLKGCCCKHVIKTLKTIQTPVVYNLLAKEMQKQAAAPGFADDHKARFLKEEELKRAKRASTHSSDADHEEAKREWNDFQRAQEAFRKKQEEQKQKKRTAEAAAKEAKAQKARGEKAEKRYKLANAQKKAAEEENEQLKQGMEKKRKADAEDAEKMARDIMANKLSMFIDSGKPKKRSKEASMEMFAEVNSMTLDEVRALVERYKI